MAESVNPLGEEHLQQINQALEGASTAEKQLTLAKRAGIDVSAQEKTLQESVANLRKIKDVYFPGR